MASKKQTRKPAKKAAVQGPSSGDVPRYSGYMVDVMPDRAGIDQPGVVVPRATESGNREGVQIPATRKYTAKYEMVDATTALARAVARQNGELPPIAGGLDELKEQSMTDFDPLGAEENKAVVSDPQPGSDELIKEERMLAQPVKNTPGVVFDEPDAHRAAPRPRNTRTRVALELQDGTMTMPAMAVLPEAYGITILFQLLDDGVTFIPKPGSSVTVIHEGTRYPCYFPGTYFTWSDMNCMGLVFVRADEERE